MKIDELLEYGETWDDETAAFMLDRLEGTVTADELSDALYLLEGRPRIQQMLLTRARGWWDGMDLDMVFNLEGCLPRDLLDPLVTAFLKEKKASLSMDELLELRDVVGEGAGPELAALLDPSGGRVLSGAELVELLSRVEDADDVARREIAKGTRLTAPQLMEVLDNLYDHGAVITAALDGGLRLTPEQAVALLEGYDVDDVPALLAATDGSWTSRQISDVLLYAGDTASDFLIARAKAGEIRNVDDFDELMFSVDEERQLELLDALFAAGAEVPEETLLDITGDIDAKRLRSYLGHYSGKLDADLCWQLCALCPDLDDATINFIAGRADMDEDELLTFAETFSDRAMVHAPDGTPLINKKGIDFLFDDTKRKWREDAQEYMTDWEYEDWYEGYYYDPNKPY